MFDTSADPGATLILWFFLALFNPVYLLYLIGALVVGVTVLIWVLRATISFILLMAEQTARSIEARW